MEGAGRTAEALAEYAALSEYYPGAEARVRYALLLRQQGREDDARRILEKLLAQMRDASKFVRTAQAEWIETAEKALGAK